MRPVVVVMQFSSTCL